MRSVASINSFEIIFGYFLTHIGRYLSHNLTNVGFQVFKSWIFICIITVFCAAPQKILTMSNRMIFSWTPNTIILFINIPTEYEMRFIAEENLVRRISFHRLLFKHPFHVFTTLLIVSWLQLLLELNFT